jgi:hypothetical protein
LKLLFTTVKVLQQFRHKMGWDTFWALFSKTHLGQSGRGQYSKQIKVGSIRTPNLGVLAQGG